MTDKELMEDKDLWEFLANRLMDARDQRISTCLKTPYRYGEIRELYRYCVKQGINAKIEELYDGYAVRFPDGSDFVQHYGSYGSSEGCVEPAVNGCRNNYTAMTLEHAKRLVRRNRERLNKSKEMPCE